MGRRRATRAEAKSFSRICYVSGGILIALTPFSADPFPAALGVFSILFGIVWSLYAKPISERKEEKKNKKRQALMEARQERIRKRQALYMENPQPMQIKDHNGVWLDISERLVIAKVGENMVLCNAADVQDAIIVAFEHRDGYWYAEGKTSCTVNSKRACDRYQLPFTEQAVFAYRKPLMIIPGDLLDVDWEDKFYCFEIRAKQ